MFFLNLGSECSICLILSSSELELIKFSDKETYIILSLQELGRQIRGRHGEEKSSMKKEM